jgi:hypothetical protein
MVKYRIRIIHKDTGRKGQLETLRNVKKTGDMVKDKENWRYGER